MLHIEYPAVAPAPVSPSLVARCMDRYAEEQVQERWTDQACAICDRVVEGPVAYFTVAGDLKPFSSGEVYVRVLNDRTEVQLARWPFCTHPERKWWSRTVVEQRIRYGLGATFDTSIMRWTTTAMAEASQPATGAYEWAGGDEPPQDYTDWTTATLSAAPTDLVCSILGTMDVARVAGVVEQIAERLGGLNARGDARALWEQLRVPTQLVERPWVAWEHVQLSVSGMHPEDAKCIDKLRNGTARRLCRLAACRQCEKELFGAQPRMPLYALANGHNRCAQVLQDCAFQFQPARPVGHAADTWQQARREFYTSAYAVSSSRSLGMLGLPRLTAVEGWLLSGCFVSSHYTVFRLSYHAASSKGGSRWPVARMRGNHMVRLAHCTICLYVQSI